jgi:hypothetical protein
MATFSMPCKTCGIEVTFEVKAEVIDIHLGWLGGPTGLETTIKITGHCPTCNDLVLDVEGPMEPKKGWWKE